MGGTEGVIGAEDEWVGTYGLRVVVYEISGPSVQLSLQLHNLAAQDTNILYAEEHRVQAHDTSSAGIVGRSGSPVWGRAAKGPIRARGGYYDGHMDCVVSRLDALRCRSVSNIEAGHRCRSNFATSGTPSRPAGFIDADRSGDFHAVGRWFFRSSADGTGYARTRARRGLEQARRSNP